MIRNFLSVLIIFLIVTARASSQDMGLEILGVKANPYSGPYPLLTLDTLENATSIEDIYTRFKKEWVESYDQVTISSVCGDEIKSAIGPDDILTQEQKMLISQADLNCDVHITIDYTPNNSLSYNPPRQLKYFLKFNPIYEAKLDNGLTSLKPYLLENASKINNSENVKLAKARFTVLEDGSISDARIVTSAESAQVDEFILNTLCSMDNWSPAQDRNKRNIAQEFELSLGTDLLRCDYYAN